MSAIFPYQLHNMREVVLLCIARSGGVICLSSTEPRLPDVVRNLLQFTDFESDSRNVYRPHDQTLGSTDTHSLFLSLSLSLFVAQRPDPTGSAC